MGIKVLVYESDSAVKRALLSFFRGKSRLHAHFLDTVEGLREKAGTCSDGKAVCIVSTEVLGKIKPSELGCPVIATVAANPSKGIKKALRYGIENYVVSPFHREDLEFKIRSAWDQRQIIRNLRKEADDLQTIVELTYLISSTLDPQEILYLIVKKVSEIIPVTRCSILRVDSEKKYIYVIATKEDPRLHNLRLELDKYPEIKRAIALKKPVVIKDVSSHPLMKTVREIIFPLGICSIVVVPVIFHEEVIGTLFLRTSRAGNTFSENEVKLLKAVANTSANSLYNAFLFEKMENEKEHLEKLAITDYLTGLYNIRFFYHRLSEEFSRSQRYKLNLSCLMIDIDHFKSINDEFGHKVGDAVLKEFAQSLKKHTRKSDVLARYGGEEFIMLLPQTNEQGAVTKAEAIRASIEKNTFRGLKGKRRLSTSIGIATYPGNTVKNKEDLITLADNALYKAKTSGRNKVTVSRS